MNIEPLLEHKDLLGESVVWSVAEEALYWVDIPGMKLLRLVPSSGAFQWWDMPELIGSIALMSGGRLLLALASGLHSFDPTNKEIALVQPVAKQGRETRLNDGRCDRQGRFRFGMVDRTGGEAAGELYRYDGSLSVDRRNIEMPNGLAFSPDGRTLYFTDSPTRQIDAYDLDPDSGAITNRRLFATVEEGVADGATVDSEGGLWVAVYDGWALLRYAPDGKLDRKIAVPVQRPTCCCFGGPTLETLYFTSASNRLDTSLPEHRLAGSIFACEPGFRGLPEPVFGVSTAP